MILIKRFNRFLIFENTPSEEPGIFDVPDMVFKLDPDRVFCLTTYSQRLAELRKTRDNYLGGNTGDYADQEHVKKELNYASRIYCLHSKWNIINVTNKPIEEISSEILSILRTKNIHR
ncbi:MAG: kinase/pyrophosphorylase [Chlorobi bacterium]|nr:kinase/pyrophosphorylase [Chlorobiota bacterium]